MARPLRIQFAGAYYHVMCRGNGKQIIFRSDHDRQKFMALLAESSEMYSVRLHAYILMDNHYHILIQTLKPNCAEFMHRLNVYYAGWFNHQHNTCGHLYQGRYKAIIIDADNYLLEVSRYLHLNPVRSALAATKDAQRQWLRASSYRWSSLSGYVQRAKMRKFVYYDQILSMIGGRRQYARFITEGIKTDVGNPLADIKYGLLLGDDAFVKILRAECIEEGSRQEQPSFRELIVENIEPRRVIECVAAVYGVDTKEILNYYGNGEIRGVTCELLYRYSGVTQTEIGKLLGGISYSGVSRLRKRLQSKLQTSQKARMKYNEAENRLRKLSIVKT